MSMKLIRLIRRTVITGLAVTVIFVIVFLSSAVLYSLMTDPRENISLSEKVYFSVDYTDKEGFFIKKVKHPELITGFKAAIIANIIQTGNFIKTTLTSVPAVTGHNSFDDLYRSLSEKIFDPDNIIYLTTGEPHSRAFYLRNFAFFYSGLLSTEAVINRDDLINRIKITLGSLEFMLTLFDDNEFTTTVIPAGGRYFAPANYNDEPSDSILGILSSLESVIYHEKTSKNHPYGKIFDAGSAAGFSILDKHRAGLRKKILSLLEKLESFEFNGEKFLIPDIRTMSAATDVRDEPARFIVSANYYTMLKKAVTLGIINDKDIKNNTGLTLYDYKKSILRLFGSRGYIQNSVACGFYDTADHSSNIVLDFAHVTNGFWDLEREDELKLFKRTADIILHDQRFFDDRMNVIKMSIANPHVRFFYRFTAPEYQGSVIWPFYNSQFARALIDIYSKTGDRFYLDKAGNIIEYIKESTLNTGGYPEVITTDGKLYRTYIYKSALANTWLPDYVATLEKYNSIKH